MKEHKVTVKKKKNNYIDNEKFLQSIITHKEKVRKAKSDSKEIPKLSDYIGTCFYLIATNLATKGKYSGYTCKDEMISDAIENCILYWYNFDETKYNNPHAYFTQITIFAFHRRIALEKKQLYIKYKYSATAGILDTYTLTDETGRNIRDTEVYDNISRFIEEYETKEAERKAKERAKKNDNKN